METHFQLTVHFSECDLVNKFESVIYEKSVAKDEKHRVVCSLIVAILDDSVLKSYQIDQQAKMTIFQREAFPKTDRFVLIPMLGRFHIGQIIFFSSCSSLKLENDRIFHGIELILEKLTCRQKTIVSVENFYSFKR